MQLSERFYWLSFSLKPISSGKQILKQGAFYFVTNQRLITYLSLLQCALVSQTKKRIYTTSSHCSFRIVQHRTHANFRMHILKILSTPSSLILYASNSVKLIIRLKVGVCLPSSKMNYRYGTKRKTKDCFMRWKYVHHLSVYYCNNANVAV